MSTGNVFENVRMEFYPPLREGETEQERLDELQRLMRGGRSWQPIETAPKNGSWLWLFTAHGISTDEQYGVGYWDDHGPYKKEMGADGVWVHFLDFEPTHWMLLPEPPRRKSDRQGSIRDSGPCAFRLAQRRISARKLVGERGFEPPAPASRRRCSSASASAVQ
jgi:hypothetical protein